MQAEEISEVNAMTREQAIERIMGVRKGLSDEHLYQEGFIGNGFDYIRMRMHRKAGAINELMAIFDIKEEEL